MLRTKARLQHNILHPRHRLGESVLFKRLAVGGLDANGRERETAGRSDNRKKVELKWNQKKTMCDTFTVLFGLIFFCAMLCMYAHPACFFFFASIYRTRAGTHTNYILMKFYFVSFYFKFIFIFIFYIPSV